MRQRIKLEAADVQLFGAIVVLLIIGILLVFDTTYARQGERVHDIWHVFRKQAVWAVVGLGVMGVAMYVPLGFLRKWQNVLVFVAGVLLVAVLMPGLGKKVNGAQSYFRFGGMGLQPSEFAKLALICLLAKQLGRPRVFAKRGSREWVTPLWISVLFTGLIVAEKDLGTAVLVIGIIFAMFYAAGARKRYVIGTGAGVLMLAVLALITIPHCKERLLAFEDPWGSRFGAGYQATHSLIAIGSGGFIGQGWCRGCEKLYFPEETASTDYIFSTLAEEKGLLGSLGLLALFGFVVFRGLDIAGRSKSTYANLLAVGLTTMVGFQALINIAVATNSIPATGVPLPLISYGGSSLVSMMVAAGLLLSVSRQVNVELEERESYESSTNGRGYGRSHISGNKRGAGTSGRLRRR